MPLHLYERRRRPIRTTGDSCRRTAGTARDPRRLAIALVRQPNERNGLGQGHQGADQHASEPRLERVYWRVVGPSNKPLTCALYRTDASLELRGGIRSGIDPITIEQA